MRILFLLIFVSFALSAADNLKDIDLEKIEIENQNSTQTENLQKDSDEKNGHNELSIQDLEEVYFQHNLKLKNSKRRVRER